MKKRIIIIIIGLVIFITLGIVLSETFATEETALSSDNVYNITLTGNNSEVVVPAGSSKTIIYQVTNTNKGKVNYGLTFAGDNITVKVYDNSIDKEKDLIDYGETKFIKLLITNTGDTDSTASIKTVLGYENDSNLNVSNIVPTGHIFVTEVHKTGPPTLIEHITNLYTNGNPELIKQSSSDDTYYYSYQDSDKTWGLMNDRLKVDTTQDETTIGLATTVTDTTKLTTGTEGNIRYFGPSDSVNNYIYFNCETYPDTNCELWRIIGVFDGKVKIIRNDSIGNLAWDQDKNQDSSLTTYSNNWKTSSLQLMLNSSYLNGDTAGTITYYSGSTGGTSTSLNMSNIGIKNATTRGMISESIWYLGGYKNSQVYPNEIYTYERTNTVGTTILSGNPFTITANVGLMYASDYGYATDLSKCSVNLYSYDSSTDSYACRANNWLFNSAYQWLITPHSSYSSRVWRVDSYGCVYGNGDVCNDYGVRPVLYLNSELTVGSGNAGSSTDPYRIKVS